VSLRQDVANHDANEVARMVATQRVPSGVHQRSGVALQVEIITFAIQEATDLVHVRLPIDLRVIDESHDENAEA